MLLSVALREEADVSIAVLQTGKYCSMEGSVHISEKVMNPKEFLNFDLLLFLSETRRKKGPLVNY